VSRKMFLFRKRQEAPGADPLSPSSSPSLRHCLFSTVAQAIIVAKCERRVKLSNLEVAGPQLDPACCPKVPHPRFRPRTVEVISFNINSSSKIKLNEDY